MMKNQSSKLFMVLIVMILVLNTSTFFVTSEQIFVEQTSISFFTLSFDGTQKDYSLDDLKALPAITGNGGRLKVTGEVIGPYEYKGVSITTLANEFSTLPSRFNMVALSDDGYVFKYTFDQIQGKVQIYDQKGNSQGFGDVNMILAYAEDGNPLIYDGPLRIAFVDNYGTVTDAFLWSKFVEEIEFVFVTLDSKPPSISIDKPTNAIYLFDQELIPYVQPFIIGDITIEVSAYDENEIAKVLFIMNDNIISKQRYQPYRWNFDTKGFGRYTIRIVSYDNSGNIGTAQKEFIMFNFF